MASSRPAGSTGPTSARKAASSASERARIAVGFEKILVAGDDEAAFAVSASDSDSSNPARCVSASCWCCTRSTGRADSRLRLEVHPAARRLQVPPCGVAPVPGVLLRSRP